MKFEAIEAAVPQKQITNDDILQMLMCANQNSMSALELNILIRSVKRFFTIAGTSTRYVRDKNQNASGLILNAASSALTEAKLEPSEIDLLIYVGIGRGFLEPATANVFQDLLKLTNATSFDLLDACASWVRAIHIAKALLKVGFYKKIMIINGEFIYNDNIENHLKFNSLRDLEHKFAIFTIGEAATASILSESDEEDEYYASFKTYGELRNLCMIPFPNVAQYNATEGDDKLKAFQFYSYSNQLLAEGSERMIEHFLNDREINAYSFDISFAHSASDHASDFVNKKCTQNTKALYKIHYKFGNTISASVPLAMATAIKEKKLKHNDRVMIGMASAGLTTGWTRFRFLKGGA